MVKIIVPVLIVAAFAGVHGGATAPEVPPAPTGDSQDGRGANAVQGLRAQTGGSFHAAADADLLRSVASQLEQALKDPEAAFEAFMQSELSQANNTISQAMARGIPAGQAEDKLAPALKILTKARSDKAEKAARLKIFKKNLKNAAKQNNLSGGNTVFGITPFTHLTKSEFKRLYLVPDLSRGMSAEELTNGTSSRQGGEEDKGRNLLSCGKVSFPYISGKWTPASFDWRNVGGKSYVTPVKNQGSCGSCSAFAVTSGAEKSLISNYGYLGYNSANSDISEQDYLDCSSGNQCQGAWPSDYLNRVTCTGFAFESRVPYRGVDYNQCTSTTRYTTGDRHWATSPTHQYGVTQSVQAGPTVIVINADYLQSYRGGVWDCGSTPSALNHAVSVVGWNDNVHMSNGQTWKVFNVKNSWGTGWGDNGYFYLRKDCGGVGSLRMYNTLGGVLLR